MESSKKYNVFLWNVTISDTHGNVSKSNKLKHGSNVQITKVHFKQTVILCERNVTDLQQWRDFTALQ